MTIWRYTLLRAAYQRMTPEETGIALELAEAADDGMEGAADALFHLMNEVLFGGSQSQNPKSFSK